MGAMGVGNGGVRMQGGTAGVASGVRTAGETGAADARVAADASGATGATDVPGGRQPVLDTAAFYRESCEKRFVKVDDIARNKAWETDTDWGRLQVTVNLSKPEKDPRAIAAAATQEKSEGYVDPATGAVRACPLCPSQADLDCGYARALDLGGEPWALWYSPYAYFNEHCIVMSWEHRPMHIDRSAFEHLCDVVDALPHYFIGSNADLPIVGGSILSHDHFQGGCHTFPLQEAPIVESFALSTHPRVAFGIVKWPVSVLRLESSDRAALVDAACHVLDAWRVYSDPTVGIVSVTGEGGLPLADREVDGQRASRTVRHNTITPMLLQRDGRYVLDLALRCNITSPEHPLGVFHPHEDLHHIKKENIGLIEVMGLAILPPRVLRVMEERNLDRDDVGRLYARVLEDAGVFKWDACGREALAKFISSL